MSASLYFCNPSKPEETFWDSGINMANRNMRIVLAALGLDTDYDEAYYTTQQVGYAAVMFLSSEMATVVDGGRATKVEVGANGATAIDCGLPAGYITERVRQIRDACAVALRTGLAKAYIA